MTATCTVVVSATGQKCGAPAVSSFNGFHECAEHDVSHIVAEAKHTGYDVGDTCTVSRYGKTYIGQVVRVTRTGRVFARFTYGNGATRVVDIDA